MQISKILLKLLHHFTKRQSVVLPFDDMKDVSQNKIDEPKEQRLSYDDAFDIVVKSLENIKDKGYKNE